LGAIASYASSIGRSWRSCCFDTARRPSFVALRPTPPRPELCVASIGRREASVASPVATARRGRAVRDSAGGVLDDDALTDGCRTRLWIGATSAAARALARVGGAQARRGWVGLAARAEGYFRDGEQCRDLGAASQVIARSESGVRTASGVAAHSPAHPPLICGIKASAHLCRRTGGAAGRGRFCSSTTSSLGRRSVLR
jgi:hypothetical protein